MVTITPQNGQIPGALLRDVPGGHLLRFDAASSFVLLSAAMDSAGLGLLRLSLGLSAYRSLADQKYLIKVGMTTMPAGHSQHGEGVAADFAGLGGFGGARYLWLSVYAPAYGWNQPAWAVEDGSLPEYWHWEFSPGAVTHPAIAQEDDMPITDAEFLKIRESVWGQYVIASKGYGPAAADVFLVDIRADVDTINRKVDALGAQIAAIKPSTGGGAIDYVALAKAVNDDAARRMLA